MPVTELTERRTADTKTYDLDNGQRRLVCGGGNSHFLNEQTGLYEDVDYSAPESPVTAGFTHYFSKGQLRAEIDAVNGILRIYPVRGDNAKYLEVRAHPTNSISVNVEVFRQKAVRIYKSTPNVDYNWLLSDRGFKVYLHLKTNAAPSSYTFGFRFVNLQRSGRSVFDGENFIGTLPNAWLEDANGVRRDVIETIDDALGRVTLDADLSGLTLPVTIDPTLTIQGDGCADSFINSMYDDHWGGFQSLELGTYFSNVGRGLFRFDATAIPSSVTLVSSQLSLYQSSWLTPTITLDCLNLTRTDWAEYSSRWSEYKSGSSWTTPGGDYDEEGKTSQQTAPEPLNWVTFNVLALSWYWHINGKVNNFLIKEPVETPGGWTNHRVMFRSREYGYLHDPTVAPKLVIDYTEHSGYPAVSQHRKARRLA